MKTKAFIISNNEIIAQVTTDLKNRASVIFANQKSKEEINANREYNLINAENAKISRAKKWFDMAKTQDVNFGIEINQGEFLVYLVRNLL